MALSNPTKLVNVQELAYFYEQLAEELASGKLLAMAAEADIRAIVTSYETTSTGK